MRWFVVALLVIAAAGCGPVRDEGDVKSFSATLTVANDGSLDVVERLSVVIPAGATTFRRRADLWRADAVTGIRGEVDDREGGLSTGKGPGLDVAWSLAGIPPGEHTLTLRYRLVGAVEISGIRGTVAWRFQNPYSDIKDLRFKIVLPVGVVLLGDPWVDEAGFEVTRHDNGMSATGRVSAGGSATPGLTFTIDTMRPDRPRWQYYRSRAKDLIPAFLAGGAFILVIGAGAVGMLRLKYRPFRAQSDRPDDLKLTPGMEAALMSGRYTPDVETELRLAGLIDVERKFVVRDLGRAANVSAAVGLAGWFVAGGYFSHLDWWPKAIPAAVIVSAAMFWYESRRMSILSERGVRARALLYSARIRDGQTPA